MYDLRSETDNQKLVDEIAEDWTTSSISPIQMAMCEFAKKLTENPSKVNKKDINELQLSLESTSDKLNSHIDLVDARQINSDVMHQLDLLEGESIDLNLKS